MVVYNLACDKAHRFEGWFASPETFDKQINSESVNCPVCGSNGVVRQPAVPHIAKHVGEAAPANQSEKTLWELQAKILKHITQNSEDVGKAFPEEARRMHYREAPERAIRGEATHEQAEALREEGIDVVALPIAPLPPKQLH